jgi:hypothetical protein
MSYLRLLFIVSFLVLAFSCDTEQASIGSSSEIGSGVGRVDSNPIVIGDTDGDGIADETPQSSVNAENPNEYTVTGFCAEDGTIVRVTGDATKEITCSKGPFELTLDISDLPEGELDLVMELVNSSGEVVTEQDISLSKDTTAPEVAIDASVSSTFITQSNSASYRVFGTCDDETAVITISVSGLKVVTDGSCASGVFDETLDLTFLRDGTFAMIVTAKDPAGNVGVDNASVLKDVTDPNLFVLNLSPNQYFEVANIASYTISGMCSEEGANTVVMSSPISATTDCSSGQFFFSGLDFSGESDGTVNVVISQTDAASNTKSFSIPLVKDTTPPVVTGLSSSATPVKTVTWNWGCDEGTCEYRLALNNNTGSPFTNENFGSTTTFTRSFGDGTFYFHVQAKDAAGNVGAPVEVTALLDNTPSSAPSGIALNGMSTPGNTSTPDLQLSGLVVGETLEIYSDSTCDTSLGSYTVTATTEVFSLAALAPGAYDFYADTTDSAGNTSSCSSATDSYEYDNVSPDPPTIPVIGAVDTTVSVTPVISFTASDSSDVDHYEVRVLRASDDAEMKAFGTHTSGNRVSGLTLVADTNYYFEIKTVDIAGNESSILQSANFTAKDYRYGADLYGAGPYGSTNP